jgi:peptidoglycan/LPS O-acetylase OafA/YrhL
MRSRQRELRRLAGALIAASVSAGILAIFVRGGWGGSAARALEGATLFLAAAAYLTHVLAHHDNPRELLTKSILVSAFALWG